MALRVLAPELSSEGGMIRLTSEVGGDALPGDAPRTVWFSVTSGRDLELSTLSDPYLVGLLPVAMKLGVGLVIEGTVSQRLAYGMQAYQDMLSMWWPETFRRVPVEIETAHARRDDRRPVGVGCCFSGGIDSYSAVQELRAPRLPFPELRISHAVMINGFDQIVDLELKGVAQSMEDAYRGILEGWDVDLVMVHSNLKVVRDAVFPRDELVRSFASTLTACAHALAPALGRFHVPGHATYAHSDLAPEGAHPALDHHLSSDQLEVRHTGAQLSRLSKLEGLLDEAPAREGLRVCNWEPTFDLETGRPLNCGSCLKCAYTIGMLELLDALDDFPTFAQREPMDSYRDPRRLARASSWALRDLLALAQRRGRKDWSRAIRKAVARKR